MSLLDRLSRDGHETAVVGFGKSGVAAGVPVVASGHPGPGPMLGAQAVESGTIATKPSDPSNRR